MTFLCVETARAQEGGTSAVESASRAIPARDFSMSAGTGAFLRPEGGGVFAEMAATYRTGLLELGGFGQAGAGAFGDEFFGAGATVGLAWRAPVGLRLSLAGAGGAHVYRYMGRSLLESDSGATGEALFVGTRAGASWIFGPDPTHFVLGLAGTVESDLIRRGAAFNGDDVDPFSGSPATRRAEHTVGPYHAALSLQLGVIRDLL